MKIIAVASDIPGVSHDRFVPHLKAESLRVWELIQSNVLREIYFRADQRSAVLISECTCVEEAKQALDTLPLVREGLITFDLIPLAPYSGFANLFAHNT